MASEHWTDRLSEYLDGELDAPDRAACRAHLDECRECADTLEELRAVVEEASALPDVPPERELWPAIEARLTPRVAATAPTGAPPTRPAGSEDPIPLASRRRRVVMTVPELIAAAIALVLFSAGTVWLALPGTANAPDPASAAAGDPPGVLADEPGLAAESAAIPVAFTSVYDRAIEELRSEYERRQAELDPVTVRVVEQNLAIIDAAIADAARALAQDPSSGFLSAHLASTMRRKVDLLRRAAAIQGTEI
ncbi:MAG: anti-sigma factor family protein [Gemmatimonadota bacterium]